MQKKKIGDMELRELEALLISGELNLIQFAERIGCGAKTVKVAVQNLSSWSGNEVSVLRGGHRPVTYQYNDSSLPFFDHHGIQPSPVETRVRQGLAISGPSLLALAERLGVEVSAEDQQNFIRHEVISPTYYKGYLSMNSDIKGLRDLYEKCRVKLLSRNN